MEILEKIDKKSNFNAKSTQFFAINLEWGGGKNIRLFEISNFLRITLGVVKNTRRIYLRLCVAMCISTHEYDGKWLKIIIEGQKNVSSYVRVYLNTSVCRFLRVFYPIPTPRLIAKFCDFGRVFLPLPQVLQYKLFSKWHFLRSCVAMKLRTYLHL